MPRSKPYHKKLCFVGEAFGEKEELLGVPFVGAAGKMLDDLCAAAGFSRHDCYITNVFWFRPVNNNIDTLCGKRKEVVASYHPKDGWPKTYSWPPLGKPGSLKPQYLQELFDLQAELLEVRPNLVVALGSVASWALLRTAGIKAIRGTVAESTLIPGLKVLPTIHPAALFRDYTDYSVVVSDLMKAWKEKEFPEIRRPRREVWIDPELSDLYRFSLGNIVSCDIETYGEQISCIGFAPSKDRALVIPFLDLSRPGNSYWPSLQDELSAWAFVKGILEDPNITKIFQNGLYDLQYLWKIAGIKVRGTFHDTMFIHHSLSPESPKGLGFMGSLYTEEASWKLLRKRAKEEGEKRDE